MSEARVKVDRVIFDGNIVKANDVIGISSDIQTALQSMLRHERLAGLKSSNLGRVLVRDANSGTRVDEGQVGGTLARAIFEAIKGSNK